MAAKTAAKYLKCDFHNERVFLKSNDSKTGKCYLPETMNESQMKPVPRLGLEPGTHRSGAQCATTELGRNQEKHEMKIIFK